MTITNTLIFLKKFGIEILENWITQNKERIQYWNAYPTLCLLAVWSTWSSHSSDSTLL